eukprot:3629915-Prymnesium_polylepis.1
MLAGNTVTIRRKSSLAHPTHNALPAGRRPLLIRTITDHQPHSCSDHQLRISSSSQRARQLLHADPAAFRALPSRAD